MNTKLSRSASIVLALAFGFISLTACNRPSGQKPVAKPPTNIVYTTPLQAIPAEPPATVPQPPAQAVANVNLPNDPSGNAKDILDQSCEKTAANFEAPGGDFFNSLRFERPFDASMNYLPFLDITRARIYRDDSNPYIYATIFLSKSPAEGKDMQPAYGVEIDYDIDGRGDLLVLATNPSSTEWTSQGLQIFEDADENVGGPRPIKSDAPSTGNGYETLVFDQGKGDNPDAAFVRINPAASSQVQFAFKKNLLGGNQGFLWNALADASIKDPAKFDYNDLLTYEEAGSPIRGNEYFYPIKNLWGIDNTCRGASNYATNGNEPGLCKNPPKVMVDASPETPSKPNKPDGGSWSGSGTIPQPPDGGGSWSGGGTVPEPPVLLLVPGFVITPAPPCGPDCMWPDGTVHN